MLIEVESTHSSVALDTRMRSDGRMGVDVALQHPDATFDREDGGMYVLTLTSSAFRLVLRGNANEIGRIKQLFLTIPDPVRKTPAKISR